MLPSEEMEVNNQSFVDWINHYLLALPFKFGASSIIFNLYAKSKGYGYLFQEIHG